MIRTFREVRGAGIIELVIGVPILLLLSFGVADLALYMRDYREASQLASAAAQASTAAIMTTTRSAASAACNEVKDAPGDWLKGVAAIDESKYKSDYCVDRSPVFSNQRPDLIVVTLERLESSCVVCLAGQLGILPPIKVSAASVFPGCELSPEFERFCNSIERLEPSDITPIIE